VLAAVMAIGLASGWAPGPAHACDASLATQASVNRGETISLAAGTRAAADHRIAIYRFGDDEAAARGSWRRSRTRARSGRPADAVSGICRDTRARASRAERGAASSSWSATTGTSDILFQVADATLHAPAQGRATADLALARWLERNGYDVSYTTGADVARRGELLARHKVFLSTDDVGDWSHAQRRSVERARDGLVPGQQAPVHLAFFGGRAQARRGARIDRTPERTEGEAPFDRLEIPAPEGRLRFWRNTPNVSTLRESQVWAGPVGNPTESTKKERDQDDAARPAGLVRLSKPTVETAFHKRPGGALVFASGTAQWPSALDGRTGRKGEGPSLDLQQATVNLLADMGVEPATLQPGLLPASASTDRTAVSESRLPRRAACASTA
jgi:hypothetical protein